MLKPFQGSKRAGRGGVKESFTAHAAGSTAPVTACQGWLLPAPLCSLPCRAAGCLRGAWSGVAGTVCQGMGQGVRITQLLAQPGFLIIPPHSSNPISTCVQYFIYLKHWHGPNSGQPCKQPSSGLAKRMGGITVPV